MASPQVEDGYTRIAHEVLEAFMKIELSPGETKVILALFRETYGKQRKHVQMNSRYFHILTNIPRSTLKRSIKALRDDNIISVYGAHLWASLKKREKGLNRGPLKASIYSIQKDYEKWSRGSFMGRVPKVDRLNNETLIKDINTSKDKERKRPINEPLQEKPKKQKKKAPPARPLKKWDSKKFIEEFDPIAKKVRENIGTIGNGKFPYDWAAQKIKQGWSPEIIIQVTEGILKSDLSEVKKPFAYFDAVWKTTAPNLKSQIAERDHEAYKENMKNGVEKLAKKVFKDI